MRLLMEDQPFIELAIKLAGAVTGIDELDGQFKLLSFRKVLLRHHTPVVFRCFRHAGVSITGKIDKIELIIYEEKIYALRAARRVGGTGQTSSIKKRIDQ